MDPVVTVKLRVIPDFESATAAGRELGRAAQAAMGGIGGGVGGGGVQAAAAGMSPGNRPITNDYTMRRAQQGSLGAQQGIVGGISQDLSFVRGQRGESIDRLRQIIHDRNAATDMFRGGVIDQEQFDHSTGRLGKDYERERGFLKLTRTNEYQLERRLSNTAGSDTLSRERQLGLSNKGFARNHNLSEDGGPSGSAYGTNAMGYGVGERGRGVDKAIESAESRAEQSAQKVGNAIEKLFTTVAASLSEQEQKATVAGYRSLARDTIGGLQDRDRQHQKYRDLFHSTVGSLAGEDASALSQRSAQHQNYRDLFHQTTRKLGEAEFEDGLLDMGPNAQRRALQRRAGSQDDPIEAMRTNRRAASLKGKTGLHTEIMGNGMMMNAMFGGWEVASAVNAVAGADTNANRMSPVKHARAQAEGVMQGAGGIFGQMVLAPMNIADMVSRRNGGKGNSYSIRALMDAVAGMEEGGLDNAAGAERLGAGRGFDSSARGMTFAGRQASDPDQFRTARLGSVRAHEERMRSYDEETKALRDRMEVEQDTGVAGRLSGQISQRTRRRDEINSASWKQSQGESAGVNRAERFAIMGRDNDASALWSDAEGGFMDGQRRREEGAIAAMVKQAEGTNDYEAFVTQGEKAIGARNYRLASQTDSIRRQMRGDRLGAQMSMLGDRPKDGTADADLWDATRDQYEKQDGDFRAMQTGGLENRQRVSGILANDTGKMRGFRAGAMGIAGSAALEAEGLARSGLGEGSDARRALQIGRDNLEAFKNDYMGNIRGKGVSDVGTLNVSGDDTSSMDKIAKAMKDAEKRIEKTNTLLSQIVTNTAKGAVAR